MSKKNLLTGKKENSVAVAFTRFSMLYFRNPDALFCFFEGKDDSKYYYSRIKNLFQGTIQPIICGNKESVLELFERIKKRDAYDAAKKAFFIDRDFDPSIEEKYDGAIYETPTYSIENFYTSIEAFSEILKHEFMLLEIDSDFDKCLNLFRERQKEFHDSVLLLNAWISCQRDLKHEKGIKSHLNLPDDVPRGFVSISLQQVKSNYNLEDIKRKFAQAEQIEETVLNEKINTFQTLNPQQHFRGKYELQFLRKILRSLIEDANVKDKQVYLSQKTHFNFDEKQLISQLQQYADTPEDLIIYLKKIIQ